MLKIIYFQKQGGFPGNRETGTLPSKQGPSLPKGEG